MNRPAVALDVTPLQNAHRDRGIGTYVRGLAEALLLQEDVPLEVWGWRSSAPPLKVARPHVARWMRRPPMPAFRGAWAFAGVALRLHALASSVDTIHVTDPDALVAIPGRRMIATVYDLIPLHEGFPRRQVVARVGYWRYLRALRRSDRYLAISEATRDDLVASLSVARDRIAVARPGVTLPAIAATPPPRRPYFLFLGGPNPNKNLSLLLEALASAPDLTPELVVAGRWLPRQVSALEATISGDPLLRGRVRHVGYVDAAQLPGLMRAAAAVVVPSTAEGFGLPVAEAMAAGAAVVHSAIPVLEDVSQGAALTFDPRSPAQLAARLREVAQDPSGSARLRARGTERALRLGWEEAVRATLDLYREAGRHAGGPR